jgi:hypothetical protein
LTARFLAGRSLIIAVALIFMRKTNAHEGPWQEAVSQCEFFLRLKSRSTASVTGVPDLRSTPYCRIAANDVMGHLQTHALQK